MSKARNRKMDRKRARRAFNRHPDFFKHIGSRLMYRANWGCGFNPSDLKANND